VEKAEQTSDGDSHQEAKQVASGGLGGDKTQGSAEKHDALNANVQNACALADELGESSEGENR
jgi:hypothetical protein